ncbi:MULTISPECIES: 2,3-bisphosphoglycerate-independent phosphoglycerate mutase [unclassified Fusibacter]|uniref:2,3-bisphosphoglycerate-independent phosphoglycerate mutase n=1 Tax=unclassified Fusibacter TaxID=2624464 RepID=UPI001012A976|nr:MULTISPECIES: 2,3-bisphosphoglycerate-independent phosphoglycerate mutase [unclassified Fusibacter]MCK8059741.1 2,3-bisphosphoglycerate-independent phosphoglycerate mutase [Fusibacter sp. A2]NPE21542.1 2,3-bisphosphoglycerate-independent phosphoglycerate mutase [Fusibacter sp. A1]RXV61951.1 2,3-bisphosphoglycerate-independent phosphoglycerate mutase [Fusibacter sp. A1]
MKKPVALLILDGWGYSELVDGNAIAAANTPNFDRYMKDYPNTIIAASGREVGLPPGQMGNSEVGHLNIGAGRVVYQPLMRITKAIEDGEFFEHPQVLKAVENAKKHDSAMHLLGLLSDGGVHSHIEHIKGCLDLAKRNGLKKVYVHAFLDGRDTPPRSAYGYAEELQNYMDEIGVGAFASVGGRYYAMDRDNRWDRVKLGYDALVNGIGQVADSALVAIKNSYDADTDDEFVLPTVIQKDGKAVANIDNHDSVFFFNFRPDRARQITRALTQPGFDGFERKELELEYVTMTEYDKTFVGLEPVFVADSLESTFGEYISQQGLNQLRIAETEKYAHVTFFFNGGVEVAYEGEDRILVESPKVATYDLQPTMSAPGVTSKLLEAVASDKYDVIIANYANPDMVGHTGVFDAAVKAIEEIDADFGKVADAILEKGGAVLITADHGNAEQMIDPNNGAIFTAHTTNPVPLIIAGVGDVELKEGMKLSDLAPTMLGLLDLEKPALMSGESIIK